MFKNKMWEKLDKKIDRLFPWLIIYLAVVAGILLDSWESDHRPLVFPGLAATQEAQEQGLLPDGSKASIQDGATDYRGAVWVSGPLEAERGEHCFRLSYRTDTPGSFCELYTDKLAGKENQPERLLARVALAPDRQTADIPISIGYVPAIRYRIIYGGGSLLVSSMSDTVSPQYRDTALLALLLLVLPIAGIWAAYRYWGDSPKGAGAFTPLAVAGCLAAGLIAALPLMTDFLTYGHDLSFHLNRIESLCRGMQAGQFPVRIYPTFLDGHGYCLGGTYPDLFLYFPALLRLCGISPMLSFKVFCVAFHILTAFIAYYAFFELTRSEVVALLACLLYTLSLYRTANLYTRQAIGEWTAMAFLPLLLLGMYRLLFGDAHRYLPFVIGCSGLLGCHVLITSQCVVFCVIVLLCCIRRVLERERLAAFIQSGVLVLLLNLWFLVPFLRFSREPLAAISLFRSIGGGGAYPAQMFVAFADADGFNLGRGSTAQEMTLSIGWSLTAGLCLYVIERWVLKYRFRGPLERMQPVGDGLLRLSILALFFSSTAFPWSTVGRLPVVGQMLSAIQFPWRYLSLATLFLSLLGAMALFLIYERIREENGRKLFVVAAAFVIIGSVSPYVDDYISGHSTLIASKSTIPGGQVSQVGEYVYEGTDTAALLSSPKTILSSSPDLFILNYEKEASSLRFGFEAGSPTSGATLTLPLYHYPGYEALLQDGERLPLDSGDHFRLRLSLPDGLESGSITVRYAGFWYFTLADILSALAAIALLAGYLLCKKRGGLPPLPFSGGISLRRG